MKYFILLFMLIFNQSFSQSLYQRKWGTVLPVFNKLKQPFNPARSIKSTPFVSEVNPTNGDLYLVSPNGDEINIYNTQTPYSRLFFKFEEEKPTFIENIKFDSHNNVIIIGRTFNDKLATAGAYDTKMRDSHYGCWFVAKINIHGELVWFTYFHEIVQNTAHLSVDKHDNIYVLNRRNKATYLQPDAFQAEADEKSTMQFQDVISKLDKKGKHSWSTFYASDQSKLLALEAGSEGIFIYGVHLTVTSAATFFGTPGAFQENVTGSNNTSAVFISKFDFDGKRLWSTYFGGQKTFAPLANSYISKNSSPLSVIGDDVYFITMHAPGSSAADLSTPNAYHPAFKDTGTGRTVSCFSGKGLRKWTTYIEAGDMLQKSFDKKYLVLTATLDSSKEARRIKTTQNAYQQVPGGANDILTYMLSSDGTQIKYSSWYGFKGNDTGITVPTLKGYYIIGFSQHNEKADTKFADADSATATFISNDNDYMGNFIGCFTLSR